MIISDSITFDHDEGVSAITLKSFIEEFLENNEIDDCVVTSSYFSPLDESSIILTHHKEKTEEEVKLEKISKLIESRDIAEKEIKNIEKNLEMKNNLLFNIRGQIQDLTINM